ncbi:uncharacterized protein [Fopius arisanus]|uniref:BRCT domain-containing protein n=1 Tax=Fopius arisanus TaxID=64838 RepID=A0A9R1TA04_9HYME|nr:PREDICTED: uncharacterized protein LOC105267897 [Fopius arisanus]
MTRSKKSNLSSIWFNPQLFTIRGAPLKFYLDGYNCCRFYEITKIIEAYGGKLTNPDTSGVFIFCEPSYQSRGQEYDLYDIKYIHDSIIALRPQNLMKYKFERKKIEITGAIDEAGLKYVKKEIENEAEVKSEQDDTVLNQDRNSPKLRTSQIDSNPKIANETQKIDNYSRLKTRVRSRPTKSSSGVRRLNYRLKECVVSLERLEEKKKYQLRNEQLTIKSENAGN